MSQVTKSWLDVHSDDIKDGNMPSCRECGAALKEGDTVDNYWPYFSQYNLCVKCEKTDAKGQRKAAWEKEMSEAKQIDNELEMWVAKECVRRLRLCHESLKTLPQEGADYQRGYWTGLHRAAMTMVALSPVSKQAWQSAGLTFDEMEMCQLEIIG